MLMSKSFTRLLLIVSVLVVISVVMTACSGTATGQASEVMPTEQIDEPSAQEPTIEILDRFRGEYEPIPGFNPLLYGLPEDITVDELATYSLESACGSDWNGEDVEQYAGTLGVTEDFVDAHQAPVGIIQWNANLGNIYQTPGNVSNVRWCSGSLIDDNLFLTAGHCFDDNDVFDADGNLLWRLPRVNNTNDIIPPSEIAQNMRVGFDYQRDPNRNLRNGQFFAITHLEEYRLNDLDYAIVRLQGNPGAIFGVQPVSRIDAEMNDMVCIIGHPAGLPKQIEAGPVNGFTDTRIRYNDIDTLGGSSGSGILHPGYEAIVGVHTNGGCDALSPGAAGGFNSGVRISVIVEASPVIRRILEPPPPPTPCVGGPDTSGCPSGWYCSEPGMCGQGCLQCDSRGGGD